MDESQEGKMAERYLTEVKEGEKLVKKAEGH